MVHHTVLAIFSIHHTILNLVSHEAKIIRDTFVHDLQSFILNFASRQVIILFVLGIVFQ